MIGRRAAVALGATSGGAALMVALTVALTPPGASAGTARPLVLTGSLTGTYRTEQSPPDMGRRYHVAGRGRTSLGATAGSGTVQGPGFIRSGHCTASLVLTTSSPRGSVTIALVSRQLDPGFSTCQSGWAFIWRTTAGTGAYRGRRGSGTGTLTLAPPKPGSPDRFSVSFRTG